MSNVTLEPFEWVEFHQDFCQKEYGVTCDASLATGGRECYNTRSTCQNPANYDLGFFTPLALRFCKSQAFLPDDAYYIPSLVAATLSAGSINPIGAGATSGALGTRGGISVQLQDHPHTDKYVDPYIAARMSRDANYIATERGTFWTKWRARNPYYVGRTIIHHSGFIRNGVVVDVVSRVYFVTAIDGPDQSGRVTIQGKDLLTKLSDEKAKAPFISNGRLLAAITDSQTSFTLDPVGIGDEEYPASGLARIGSELCTFTRIGDVMTVVRARHNTKAEAADAGDVVQLCLVYESKSPAFILEDLTKNFSGIPTFLLDLAQWAQEQTDYMPRLYSAIIADPTGVNALIAEMAEQMYFYPLWDERNAKLKMRAIRPAGDDPVYALDEFANLEKDSVDVSDLPDQLITQVWVYYGMINPVGSLTDPKNFAAREIIFTDEGSEQKNGVEKIKKIFCRWIGRTNGAAAVDLGKKIIARYGRAPRKVTFALSNKDLMVWLGDFATISHKSSVDDTGLPIPLNVQVMSAQQQKPGTRFVYTAQEFVFEAPVDPTEKLIIISDDVENLNLRDEYDGQIGVPPVSGDTIRIEIRPGVVIGGRGYEGAETFTGEVASVNNEAPVHVYSRSIAPLMRSGLSAAIDRARGSNYLVGATNYILMSDVKEVPCSIAFDTGLWPFGVNLVLTQAAGSYVAGESGFASVCGGASAVTSANSVTALALASDGGHALRIRHPIQWNNQGVIAAGGAGGFPSVTNAWRNNRIFGKGWLFSLQPGGSGAGRFSRPALGSSSAPYDNDGGGSSVTATYGINTAPSAGSLTAGGFGTVGTTTLAGTQVRAKGGAGGVLGGNASAPTQSRPVVNETTITLSPIVTSGGVAGHAIIEGASLITWINKGDVRGAEVA